MQIWKKKRFFSNEEIPCSVDKEGQFWCCIDPKVDVFMYTCNQESGDSYVYDGYTNTVNRSAISSSIIHPDLDTSNLLLQQSFYIINSNVKNKCSFLPYMRSQAWTATATTTFHYHLHHCGNPNWRRSTVGRTTRLAWKAFHSWAFDGHRFSVLPCWNLHLSVIAATPVLRCA